MKSSNLLSAVQRSSRRAASRSALAHGLAIWSLVIPVWLLIGAARHGLLALDFRHAFMPAARTVLEGASPYSSIGSRALAEGTGFLYPPLAAYLLAPFTVLPPLVGELLATGLVALAAAGALVVLGVRDWRCYALCFLWLPTMIGIQTANVTLPLVLGLALLWHYRDRTTAFLVAALVVALKLLFWPVLVWLLATRRYRSAALAAVGSVVLVAGPWTAIGFAGLGTYPQLLASVSRREGPHSFSVAALVHALGPDWPTATVVESVLGAALLLVVLALGWRGRDRDAFALTIVATLVLTPLLEMHYLAALLVVVALYRRRLSPAWAAPLLIWGAAGGNASSPLQIVHVLVVVAVTVALAMSDWRPGLPARALRLAPTGDRS